MYKQGALMTLFEKILAPLLGRWYRGKTLRFFEGCIQ